MKLSIVEFFFIIGVLMLIGLLTSCGPYQVNVKHSLEIDLTKLETYFRSSCEIDEPENVDGCCERKVGEFLNIVLSS